MIQQRIRVAPGVGAMSRRPDRSDGQNDDVRREGPRDSGPLWVVTGAAGFLGNNLVRQLLERDQQVRAAIVEDHVPPSLAGLDVEIVQMDVRDPLSVNQAFRAEGREVWVIHCAGIVSIATSVSPSVYDVNVNGVRNVISACRQQKVEKLLYVSSVHALPVVGGVARELDASRDFNPDLLSGEYAKTKAEATALVLEATDLWRVVVFPTGIIGPHDFADTHLTRMVRDVASGVLPVSIEGGYDFVDVRDVAAAIISAAEVGQNGRTYLVSGQYVPAKKMVGAVANASGRPAPVVLPLWLARAVAPLAEFISSKRGTAPLMTAYSVRVLDEPGRFSSTRARVELGFRPRPFWKTLRDTLEWVQRA